MPPFYKTIEFWTAVLTPVLVVLWPMVVTALPFLSVLTADQVTVVIAGGIVAIIVALTGFAVMRHQRAARLGLR
jgi:hypothetical protein